ncbi:hypothetical protein AHF37_02343 [Paragonimus kellicotti]|nr:hypothetical protein AHF37_02343 [Paragonimus kellicotti]
MYWLIIGLAWPTLCLRHSFEPAVKLQLFAALLELFSLSLFYQPFSQEERWFRESQRTHGDYRGWYFIPANPAGVNRGRRELDLDQEMGELISR